VKRLANINAMDDVILRKCEFNLTNTTIVWPDIAIIIFDELKLIPL
jgi:hypothetical protein